MNARETIYKSFRPGKVYIWRDVQNRCNTYHGKSYETDLIRRELRNLARNQRIMPVGELDSGAVGYKLK